MSSFAKEFDYVISKGWWFSVIPKAKTWRCTIYRKKNNKDWLPQETKVFPTITKGMIWIEMYITDKMDNN